MYSSFFSWSWVRVPTASHGMVNTKVDATQEDIVMGVIGITLVRASHAPLDTIVQAGLMVMANEN